MYNDYMYAIDRSDEYLEHYGIRGMKWGVRKAIESGNSKRLARQYRKASRKLAKLQARANNGAKYAKRAAALGAAGAAAGGLALAGTGGVAAGMRSAGRLNAKLGKKAGTVMERAGRGIEALGLQARSGHHNSHVRNAGAAVAALGGSMQRTGGALQKNKFSDKALGASQALQEWGKGTNKIASSAADSVKKGAYNALSTARNSNKAVQHLTENQARKMWESTQKKSNITNNQVARIGAGAAAAGLLGAAGYNAYRAATTKKAAKKAAQFESEMNKAFAGTKYGKSSSSKKRRRN